MNRELIRVPLINCATPNLHKFMQIWSYNVSGAYYVN